MAATRVAFSTTPCRRSAHHQTVNPRRKFIGFAIFSAENINFGDSQEPSNDPSYLAYPIVFRGKHGRNAKISETIARRCFLMRQSGGGRGGYQKLSRQTAQSALKNLNLTLKVSGKNAKSRSRKNSWRLQVSWSLADKVSFLQSV